MHKLFYGLLFGAIAGVLDVIPMILQGLPLAADVSAFVFWIVCGVLLVFTHISEKGYLNGMFLCGLAIIPVLFVIGWEEPLSVLPIFGVTLILGGLLGAVLSRFNRVFSNI